MKEIDVNVCLITIHIGEAAPLRKTLASIKPFLDWEIFSGYLIYESNSQSLNHDEVNNSKIIYFHNEPKEGICNALNKSQLIANEQFPRSTHYCYVHSGDLLSPDLETKKVLSEYKVLPHSDIITWGYKYISQYSNISFKPEFENIAKSMTISHIGTFISHELHSKLRGYSTEYRYAMDYDFFLRARNICNYKSFDSILTTVDGFGISSRYPYLSIRDVYISQIKQLDKKLSFEFFSYSLHFLLKISKRSIFNILKYTPNLRNSLQSLFNKRIIKTKNR